MGVPVGASPGSEDVVEVDELEDGADVEDGIDWEVDGHPNSGVAHALFWHWHLSSASYLFFKAFLRALLLRTRSRGAEGGNGESPSIQAVSLPMSHNRSSSLLSIPNVSTGSHVSAGSNFFMRSFALPGGMNADNSAGDSAISNGEPIDMGMTGDASEGVTTWRTIVMSSEPGIRTVTDAISMPGGGVSAVPSIL